MAYRPDQRVVLMLNNEAGAQATSAYVIDVRKGSLRVLYVETESELPRSPDGFGPLISTNAVVLTVPLDRTGLSPNLEPWTEELQAYLATDTAMTPMVRGWPTAADLKRAHRAAQASKRGERRAERA